MRAVIKDDPVVGQGHGILEIYGVGEMSGPCLILWRADCSLSEEGWSEGAHTLASGHVLNTDACVQVSLGPEVMEYLEPGAGYELEIVGIGRCALINSSRLREDGDSDEPSRTEPAYVREMASTNAMTGPDVMADVESPDSSGDNSPQDDAVDAALASGTAAGPDNAIPDRPPRRMGCWIASIILLILWAAGGWLFWHLSMNSEVSDREEVSSPFEIIPKSTDSSYIEEDENKEAESGVKR